MKKRLKVASSPPPTIQAQSPLESPHGKMRTSLLIDVNLSQRAKDRAAEMGMSFNSFVAMAIFRELHPNAPSPSVTELTGARADYLSTEHGRAQGMTPPFAQRPLHSSKKDPLAKFGPGFTYGEEGEDWFATWDQIEAYNQELAQHPDADWRTLGPRLNLTQKEARAADLAVQLPEFEAYMSAKYGEARVSAPPAPAPSTKTKKGHR
jgi:hypothetical protein